MQKNCYLDSRLPGDQLQESDELLNYSVKVCLWVLHLMQLHGTAKDADMYRVFSKPDSSIPFFYLHSHQSKYLVMCIDYIIKGNFYSSSLDKLRVLERSFVNLRGGHGQNFVEDLVQEHTI